MIEGMTKLFSVTKTIRFELRPIGKTAENLEKNKTISKDETINTDSKQIKLWLDELHKEYIEKTLQKLSENQNFKEELKKYEEIHLQNNSQLEKEEKKNIDVLIKMIKDGLTKPKEEYEKLFGKYKINALLEYYKDEPIKLEIIEKFKNFTTYFINYDEARKNIYTGESKKGSITNRLINENLPVFFKNIQNLQKITKHITTLRDDIKKSFNIDIEEFQNIENFANMLTQGKIERYNLAINGKFDEENKKLKGINEYINLFNQQNKEEFLPYLKSMYKQILSDSNVFFQEKIANDKEAIDLINKFLNEQNIDCISDIFTDIATKYDTDKIYIKNTYINTISQKIYNNWNHINELREKEYDEINIKNNKKITQTYLKNRKTNLNKEKYISINKISELSNKYDTETKIDIYSTIENIVKTLINNYSNEYKNVSPILAEQYTTNEKNLVKKDKDSEDIKRFLDSIKDIQSFISYFIISKEDICDTESKFYDVLNYENIYQIIPIYNKIRNYITQKEFSSEKIKINFDSGNILAGWDINKINDNLGLIFKQKENNKTKYFIGIINKNNKPKLDLITEDEFTLGCYEQMIYKYIPDPSKTLPHIFFSEKYNHPDKKYIKEIYGKAQHKKGDNFNIDSLHKIIDYYIKSIINYEDWKKYFNFQFRDIEEYTEYSQFINDVQQQGYKISFKYIKEDQIHEMVSNNQMYLFQIYTKDFSEYSKGKPNLQTIYWENLFDPQNLSEAVYKLSGGGEIFYRKHSIEKHITHKKNEYIANKNKYNSKKQSIFGYDLIKDKRYTEDKFMLHIPIEINYISKNENKKSINLKIRNKIKNNDDIKIIGIDRGERHLAYYSLINSKGEIIEQESLNQIKEKFIKDYHDLLNKKENERAEARQNWKTIDNIKELKDGYMSQVVHKITELVKKHNAIIVFEDLNSGFKNSRIKIEKQVYEKFEDSLIKKLSYLIDKNETDKNQKGGSLNGYQLAMPDNKKDYIQNGILFYVSPYLTSKIDPVTGFANLFTSKTKIDKEFIKKFKSINYNESENYYEFTFSYDDFILKNNYIKKEWVLCSNGERIKSFKNDKQKWEYKTINLTQEFKNLFQKYGIRENNIKEDILNVSNSNFFNEKNGFAMLFNLMLQMRNSIPNTEEDYIISPVKNNEGIFFDSRNCNENQPNNADSNGAYNIARKGLMLIERIKKADENQLDKLDLKITKEDWLNYIQNK